MTPKWPVSLHCKCYNLNIRVTNPDEHRLINIMEALIEVAS